MNNIAGKIMERNNKNLENNTKNKSPTISITSIQEDGSSCLSKYVLTAREVNTLKAIYEYIMQKRITDFFIESSSYKNLMNKGLVKFSSLYRNVALTTISEAIIKAVISLNKISGKVEFEGEEGSMVVEWRGF